MTWTFITSKNDKYLFPIGNIKYISFDGNLVCLLNNVQKNKSQYTRSIILSMKTMQYVCNISEHKSRPRISEYYTSTTEVTPSRISTPDTHI